MPAGAPMASSLLSLVPVIVLSLLAQRFIVDAPREKAGTMSTVIVYAAIVSYDQVWSLSSPLASGARIVYSNRSVRIGGGGFPPAPNWPGSATMSG